MGRRGGGGGRLLAEVTIMHSGLQRSLNAAIASVIGKSEIQQP